MIILNNSPSSPFPKLTQLPTVYRFLFPLTTLSLLVSPVRPPAQALRLTGSSRKSVVWCQTRRTEVFDEKQACDRPRDRGHPSTNRMVDLQGNQGGESRPRGRFPRNFCITLHHSFPPPHRRRPPLTPPPGRPFPSVVETLTIQENTPLRFLFHNLTKSSGFFILPYQSLLKSDTIYLFILYSKQYAKP